MRSGRTLLAAEKLGLSAKCICSPVSMLSHWKKKSMKAQEEVKADNKVLGVIDKTIVFRIVRLNQNVYIKNRNSPRMGKKAIPTM